MEMEGAEHGTAMQMYLMPEHCTLKNGINGNLYYVNFTMIKK